MTNPNNTVTGTFFYKGNPSTLPYPKDPITFSDDDRVYNHFLRKVFRFHYHSQKVIGSLGIEKKHQVWYLPKNGFHVLSDPWNFPQKPSLGNWKIPIMFSLSCLDVPGRKLPIGSMYGVYTYIWLIYMVNVAKYTIHGYNGLGSMGNNPLVLTHQIDHHGVFTFSGVVAHPLPQTWLILEKKNVPKRYPFVNVRTFSSRNVAPRNTSDSAAARGSSQRNAWKDGRWPFNGLA